MTPPDRDTLELVVVVLLAAVAGSLIGWLYAIKASP